MNNEVDSSSEPQDQNQALKKRVLAAIFILLIPISLGLVLARKHFGVDEQNFAVRVTFSVVDRYVKDHDGSWPTNWSDLESMPPGDEWYEQTEPLNFDFLKQHVIINFEADPQTIAYQPLQSFDAIKPKKPVFDFTRDPRLAVLKESLKSYYPPPVNDQ